jgi:hypothetical protein
MPDKEEVLFPATAEDVADALAFALRFQGRKRRVSRIRNDQRLRMMLVHRCND